MHPQTFLCSLSPFAVFHFWDFLPPFPPLSSPHVEISGSGLNMDEGRTQCQGFLEEHLFSQVWCYPSSNSWPSFLLVNASYLGYLQVPHCNREICFSGSLLRNIYRSPTAESFALLHQSSQQHWYPLNHAWGHQNFAGSESVEAKMERSGTKEWENSGKGGCAHWEQPETLMFSALFRKHFTEIWLLQRSSSPLKPWICWEPTRRAAWLA